ncbi:unnamed protein product, partial [Nesidiocoris tenuis]
MIGATAQLVVTWQRHTCSNVHVTTDDGTDVVGSRAPVDVRVHVLPVQLRRKGEQEESPVRQDSSNARHVTHVRPVQALL